MRRIGKKILLLMLTLMFIVGIMPLFSITALAAKTTNAGNETALIKAVNAGGDVKLTKDITLTDVLRIPTGKTVTLDLNGKTLNRGLTECQDLGSVIRVEPGATLTVKDSSNKNSGVITGGASWNGGGICNHGTLTIKGGTISGNKALHERYGGGGGIYNGSYNGSKATLTLEGGVIEYNKARDGGGIYNSDGTVMIHKGSYSVTVLSQLKTYETNVTIKNNEASPLVSGGSSSGSGICTFRDISIQDAPVISGNKDDKDIYLLTGKVLKLTGKLKKTAVIGIETEDYDNIITSGYFTYQTEDPNEFFKPADTNHIIRMSATKENGGEVMARASTKTLIELYNSSNRSVRKASELLLRAEYDDPNYAYLVTLGAVGSALSSCRIEMTLGSDWIHDFQITAPANGYLVIDLNGHRIVRNRNGKKIDNGGVFLVKEGGTLTINDSNPNKYNGYSAMRGGMILGGANSNGGGGITVEKGANLYMNGGTIYDCRTDYHGGGICAMEDAKIIVLKRCNIRKCYAMDSADDCSGGGIYAKTVSRLELENVTLFGCYSEDSGGGLYYYGGLNGIFIVSACTFHSNNCKDDGGAAYFSASEGGYFDKCYFTSNSAGDDGGCIYVVKNGNRVYDLKKDEPVMIRECEMISNVCGDEGSAVFVDRNDVVFVTDKIMKNAAGDKGAIYVSHNAGRYGYDISVKGLTIVDNNEATTPDRANIVLENYGATHNYIYCAGLYEGSSIWLSTLDSGKVKVLRNVDSYQLRYFHPEVGTLSFEGEKTMEANLVTASLFSNASFIVILALSGAAIVAAAVAVIYKKKKEVGNHHDGNE